MSNLGISRDLWRHAPKGLESLLLLLLTWLIMSWWLSAKETNISSMPLAESTSAAYPTKNLTKVSSVPLFGKLENMVASKDIAPKPVTNSKLDIKLLGTVVAGKRSAAVMTIGKSSETTFFLDDNLQDGVFLKAVKADAVILSNRDRMELVNLSEGTPSDQPPLLNPSTHGNPAFSIGSNNRMNPKRSPTFQRPQ